MAAAKFNRRQLAACKALGMPTRSWRAIVVPGARGSPAPRKGRYLIHLHCCLLHLAIIQQDGHHVLSARGGPHHEGGKVQLRVEEGFSRLARDLQKRASIGAARALIVLVLVLVPVCSLSRRSGSATRRGHGARVRRRLHFSLCRFFSPGKDRGTRPVRPENEWRLADAQFILHLRYGRDITEDVSGIAKIKYATRSRNGCYP